MDVIILGLLMLKGMTIYEIRKIISEQFTFISSGSTGAIQGSIKRLMEKNFLYFEEKKEKNITKKYYYITAEGKAFLIKSISQPMQNKQTDLELSKLMFMGYVEPEKRIGLIDAYIQELREEQMILTHLGKMLDDVKEQQPDYHKMYQQMAYENGGAIEFMSDQGTRDIAFFNQATLRLGIDMVDFLINWYEDLKMKMRCS